MTMVRGFLDVSVWEGFFKAETLPENRVFAKGKNTGYCRPEEPAF
jgi:hypothetical protein